MSEPTRFPVPGFLRTREGSEQLRANELEWAKRQAREQREQRLNHRARRLGSAAQLSLRPAVMSALVRDELSATLALQVTKRWAVNANSLPYLVLSGGVGCGKTVAAAWWLVEHEGVWVRAFRLAQVFAGGWSIEREEQDRLIECRHLVVDDLGTELEPSRMTPVLAEILECRRAHGMRTLITTNLEREALAQRYQPFERIKSRLSDGVQWAGCGSQDLRAAAADASGAKS